jgi:hypothetical protein
MEQKYETIEVDLTDEEFLCIAKLAHDLDITFNKMVEKILWDEINKQGDLFSGDA